LSTLKISGSEFTAMCLAAGQLFQSKIDIVNDLNVFPVPDGDTGTNMSKTLRMGLEQIQAHPTPHLGKLTETFSKGLLLGARGNSGVILSQLFRGFSKALVGAEDATTVQIAAALQQGVDTAYKAVVKPVEGTILTVAKEVAKHAQIVAKRTTDHAALWEEIVIKAQEALDQTPEQLTVLKDAGVVDSGGQGLVFIYRGFLEGIKSGNVQGSSELASKLENPKLSYAPIEIGKIVESVPAQTKISPDKNEYIYDMEFTVRLSGLTEEDCANQTRTFQVALEKVGESIVMIPDEGYVKVHVHAKSPGDVLNIAIQFGEMSGFHLENMRDRHKEIIAEYESHMTKTPVHVEKPFGIVVVASGDGIQDIFTSLGIDIVLDGGQSMNPSTEDLLTAIASTRAEHVFVLPNNANIVLTAKQAAELASQNVTVVPTTSIQQGLEAAIAYGEGENAEEIEILMTYAISQVQSGQVALSVRSSTVDGIQVNANEFVGILEGTVVVSEQQLLDASKKLVAKMIVSGEEIISIFTGEDADSNETDELLAYLQATYPNIEVEVLPGGQALYVYLFAVEK
jgi:DAK2 domain fusion protein YloV